MDNGIIAIMLGVSLIMGLLGLIAFLWGLRSGQFDDENKMMEFMFASHPVSQKIIADSSPVYSKDEVA